VVVTPSRERERRWSCRPARAVAFGDGAPSFPGTGRTDWPRYQRAPRRALSVSAGPNKKLPPRCPEPWAPRSPTVSPLPSRAPLPPCTGSNPSRQSGGALPPEASRPRLPPQGKCGTGAGGGSSEGGKGRAPGGRRGPRTNALSFLVRSRNLTTGIPRHLTCLRVEKQARERGLVADGLSPSIDRSASQFLFLRLWCSDPNLMRAPEVRTGNWLRLTGRVPECAWLLGSFSFLKFLKWNFIIF